MRWEAKHNDVVLLVIAEDLEVDMRKHGHPVSTNGILVDTEPWNGVV